MAGRPQCQDLERERKSLEGKLPGNSNRSRYYLKCAKNPSLIFGVFCVFVGLRILEFHGGNGSGCVGAFLFWGVGGTCE